MCYLCVRTSIGPARVADECGECAGMQEKKATNYWDFVSTKLCHLFLFHIIKLKTNLKIRLTTINYKLKDSNASAFFRFVRSLDIIESVLFGGAEKRES